MCLAQGKGQASEAIGDKGTRKEARESSWVLLGLGKGGSVGGLIRFTGGAKPKGLLSIGCR